MRKIIRIKEGNANRLQLQTLLFYYAYIMQCMQSLSEIQQRCNMMSVKINSSF